MSAAFEDPRGGARNQISDRIGDPRRLQVITELGLYGHDGDVHLDGVLRTLAAACTVPIIALNLVTPGQQTYVAEIGLGQSSTDVSDELSFCSTVVATRKRLVVDDAVHHEVFGRNPFVLAGAIGAYAGEPIVHRGVVVGALAVFDSLRRQFSQADLTVLFEQARLVEMVLANRYDAHSTHARTLRSLIDRSDSLIYVKDLEGRYLLVNPRLATVFSATEEELLGRTDAELAGGQAEIWVADDARELVGESGRVEYLDLPDGRHTYESTRFPLIDGSGRVYATGGVMRDVTAYRQAAAVLAADRDAAIQGSRQKSAFLATMSHEIRTPMNAVIGMTGLLQDTELDDTQQEMVETVASSGEALLGIITNILDFSTIEAGGLVLEPGPFELRECVKHALELVAAGFVHDGVDIVRDVSVDCPDRVVGDGNRLGQVLVNLLGNAVKFTPHGEVVLAVAPDLGPDGGPGVRFTVTDSGIGIPQDRLGGLFESFSQIDTSTTRIYGGTGLGLAISQRLVQAMGGELTVESVAGVGSTFEFTVPLPTAPRPSDPTPPADSVPCHVPARALRVLLAEDNAVNQRLGQFLLRKLGHRVDIVSNGADAVDAAHATRYDAILMDIEMPVLDGLEATRRIRADSVPDHRPHIIAMTASVLDETRDACQRAGMDDFLPKPVRVDDLASTLATEPVDAARG